MRAISLHGLSKSFGPVQAVAGLDLEVQAGESLVILGPSGSGKSTLLRLIAGLERADSGEIRFDGMSQMEIPPHRRGVAMVFQNFALYPHLSAQDNMMLGLRYGLKLPKTQALARVREVAQTLGIDELLQRRPGEMSGGQRQRVALGRALAKKAEVVLLDEPLSGLDAQLRQSLRVEIRSLFNSLGATAIFVTHDQLDAMAIGHRIAIMRDGRIEQIGLPEEIYSSPATIFVAQFIGSPPMNLVEGEVAGGTLSTPSATVDGHFDVRDGSVLIGIRPEHLKPTEGLGFQVQGRVIAAELSGSEWVLHIQANDATLAARCQLDHRPQSGDQMVFGASPQHLHIFGGQDGLRLTDVLRPGDSAI